MSWMLLLVVAWFWFLSPAQAHVGPLDAYGCHSNKALYGTSAKRECHMDLLAGQVFNSTTAEYKAYIAAQKALLASKDASLSACQARCPATGSAILTWVANTEPDVVGYKVYWGTASRVYQPPTVLTNATATVSNLPPGTYYFAVTAYDAAGNESAFSREVSKVIP